jgi:hypothetical protein
MVILLLEYLSNLKYRMSGSFLHHFQYTAPDPGLGERLHAFELCEQPSTGSNISIHTQVETLPHRTAHQ